MPSPPTRRPRDPSPTPPAAVHKYMYIYLFFHRFINIYICMYIYLSIYLSIYIHTHIYMNTDLPQTRRPRDPFPTLPAAPESPSRAGVAARGRATAQTRAPPRRRPRHPGGGAPFQGYIYTHIYAISIYVYIYISAEQLLERAHRPTDVRATLGEGHHSKVIYIHIYMIYLYLYIYIYI